ncbi:MAG: TIGR04255 family protein [Candidatus Humimicrobiaceae bacterium]
MKDDKCDLQYKNNFITEVIFRVDYSHILKINDRMPSEFQDKIRELLPEFNTNKIIDIKTTLIGNSKAINEPQIFPEWQFTNKDKSIVTNLSQDNINITVKKYKNIQDYKKIIMDVLNNFYTEYKPIEIKRLGLRYINKIIIKEGNPYEWVGLINDQLIGQLNGFLTDNSDITRYMSQMIISKDEYGITFNYGIYNSEYPAKIARKEFILDYDCYTNECIFEEVENRIEKFNLEIKKLFEKSIENKLRKIMEIIK